MATAKRAAKDDEDDGQEVVRSKAIDYTKVFPMNRTKATIEEAQPDLLLQKASARKIGATSALWLHKLVEKAAGAAKERQQKQNRGSKSANSKRKRKKTAAAATTDASSPAVVTVQDLRRIVQDDEHYNFLEADFWEDCEAHEGTRDGGKVYRPRRKRQRPPPQSTTTGRQPSDPALRESATAATIAEQLANGEDLMNASSRPRGEIELDEDDYD